MEPDILFYTLSSTPNLFGPSSYIIHVVAGLDTNADDDLLMDVVLHVHD